MTAHTFATLPIQTLALAGEALSRGWSLEQARGRAYVVDFDRKIIIDGPSLDAALRAWAAEHLHEPNKFHEPSK